MRALIGVGAAFALVAAVFGAMGPSTAWSEATLPSGFLDTQIVGTGLSSPTAMALAPDGRVFITEQTGSLRVVENDQLLPTPFLTVAVEATGERGLLGVAFDPAFATNQYVYILLHHGDAHAAQPGQPLHRQRQRRRAGQ